MTPYWMARRLSMEQDQDVKERLAAYLKELHLPAFRTSYQELARQAQQEGLSFEQYLLGLAQRECQERRNKRVERLLHESRLPLEKSWPSLELKRLPAKVVQQARTLLEGSFVDRRENVLVFGQPGSGRSNLRFSGGEAIYKDAMPTAGAIDRRVHHSVIIELNVPSYRGEQAKKAKQGRPVEPGAAESEPKTAKPQ